MLDRSLRDFALELYRQDGIAPLCLAWQDQNDVDVTVLLMAAWSGAGGYRLSATDIGVAFAAIAPWSSEVVRPLRALRRKLKDPAAPAKPDELAEVRQRVGAAELESEYVALRILEDHCPDGRANVDPDIALRENIAAVFTFFSGDAPVSMQDVERISCSAARIGTSRP